MSTSKKSQSLLLDIRNIFIEGYSDEVWHPIIKGVDLQINKGEV